MPNQSSDQSSQPQNPVSVISPQSDLPPMPPAFQNMPSMPSTSTTTTTPTSTTTTTTTSGAPAESSAPVAGGSPVISSGAPKKKFGGGRIIATILGLLLLIGGVGAGYILTQQPQLFQQKAGANDECTTSADCPTGYVCQGIPKTCVSTEQCSPGDTKSCSVNSCPGRNTCGQTGRWGSCQDIPGDNCPCSSSCSGITCGRANGCGKTCTEGSGCTSPSLPACGNNLNCKTTAVTGASTCQNSFGDKLWCCSAGQIINSNNTCQAGLACPAGSSCGSSSASGTFQCTSTNGQVVFCCPAGKTYDEFNGCFTPTAGSCTSDAQCTPPQFCDRGTNKCVYASNVNCGRDTDLNAPVCCSATTKSSCGTPALPGSSVVCEGPNRLECKLSNGNYCTIDTKSCGNTSPPPGTNPPSTGGLTASCQKVTAYSSTWTALTGAQLSALKSGSVVNFCVTGTASSGSFDMAKFTINGVVQPQTTTKGSGPAAAAFCQSYTIPAATYSFSVSAQIHHVTLGWSN